MRGGKRKGAGRKGIGETKIYRLPIAIENDVLNLLNTYKAKLNLDLNEKNNFENVTKSKEPIKPMFPILKIEQINRLQKWLINNNFIKTRTEAKKITNSPKKCKETFIKFIPLGDKIINKEIDDIYELYILKN
jgi:hypothetical protein